MMNLYTALGLIMLVASIIALIQEGKDKAVQSVAGILCALAAVVTAEQWVPIIDKMIEGIWWKILGVACAVLGTILVVRLKNQVVGTLLVTAGGLLCLITLNIIDWI